MSGGGGTNTTVSNNAPPAQFLDAYTRAIGQAGNVASTPYTPYPGNIVAPLSPDQTGAIGTIQSAQGIAAPFINNAAQHLDAATAPIWNDPNVQHFSPETVRQYESPYTSDVVKATAADFQNQNDISNQRVVGDAISRGAWGGDRSAVAQAINEGQNSRAQAPILAGLRNQGYTQALQEFNTQQGAGLGATQAQRWLDSQAAAGMGNLGQEALGTTLTGANAQLGIGGLEQTQAQAELNVPYQQYIAQQAYPFQTTGWFSNIAEGLGGASGGTASTTTPGPSVASQVAGAGAAGLGALGSSGAFGSNGWLSSGWGGSGGGGFVGATPVSGYTSGGGVRGHNLNSDNMLLHRATGGLMPNGFGVNISHRADGGSAPGIAGFDSPIDPMNVAGPMTGVPDVAISVVPGSTGLGSAPKSHGTMDILKNYGSTTTSSSSGGDSTIGSLLKLAGTVAATIYGGPAGGAAASALGSQVHFGHGGGIAPFPVHRSRAPGTGIAPANDDSEPFQHRASGGIAVPQIGTPSPMVTLIPSTHGGPMVPQLLPPAGAGIAPSAPTSLANYFGQTQAGRSFAPPPNLPTLNFQSPAPAPGIGDGAATGIFPGTTYESGNAVESGGGGDGGGGGGEGGGGGGAEWRGGVVGRDEGGDVPVDPSGTVWTPEAEEPEPEARTGIGPSIPFGDVAPPAAAPDTALLSKTPVGLFDAAAKAVHLNESGGRMTPGILGDDGKSGGPMQVQQAALDAVNQRAGTRITFDQMVRDPTVGKAVGDAFLDMLMAKYPGHPEYAIGAYNAGEGAMNRALARGLGVAGLPASTQVYVARAMRNMAGMTRGGAQQIAQGGIVQLDEGGDVDPSGLLVPGATATAEPAATTDLSGVDVDANVERMTKLAQAQDAAKLPGAPAGANESIPGPPPPPPGEGIAAAPATVAPVAEVKEDTGPQISPWKTLMNVGLGIMSGTSPHALTNIGRGALTGIQLSDKQQKAATDAAAKRDQIKTNAMWRAGQASLNMAREKHLGVQETQASDALALRRDQFNAGLDREKYTYQPVTQADPNDPSKTISGVMQLDPSGKHPPTFIRTDTNPNKGGNTTASVMPDDTRIMLAQQVMAGNGQALAGLGYGSAGAANRMAIQNEIATQLKKQGLTGSDLAAKTAEYMGEKAGARAAGTREANVGMAVNEAQNFMPLALAASAKVDRTQFPTLNSIIQAYDKGTGDENIVRLAVATNSLTNAYSRAITPSGIPTEGNQTRARELLDKAWSRGQYAAAVDQLWKEMQAAKASPIQVQEEQRARISGRPAVGSSPTSSTPPQYTATGANGMKLHSSDGKTWFTPDGRAYAP